jgi:flagellin
MAVINTNVKALFSQMALTTSGRAQSLAMQQLSTGKRINSARDDAAGMAIATRMTHQIRSLNQAVRNAGDAINLIQTAEGATNEITDMMQRMRELAVQAVNDTNDNAQRSYLDLEFQQLKQQVVQIADNTEWNGFPVLNGSAGERVGEMPVYKVSSNSLSAQVLINPTTQRTLAGTGAGQQQSIAFAPNPFAPLTAGSPPVEINVAGVTVQITSDESDFGKFMNKIQSTLSNNIQFDGASGRTATLDDPTNPTKLLLNYASSDGDVALWDLNSNTANSNVLTALGVTPSVGHIDSPALTNAKERFGVNGSFLQSGLLSMDINSPSDGLVAANFTTSDNKIIALTGVLSPTDGTVTFTQTSGNNRQVMAADLTYSIQKTDFTTSDITSRKISLSVNVAGGVPALKTGDLQINGVEIGQTSALDDPFSPRNNAAGSAIAKAAAINRKAVDSGVTVGEQQTLTLAGTPSPGTVIVAGVSVTLTALDNTPVLAAAKIADALKKSPQFDVTTGRSISYAPGSTTIGVTYNVNEGDVATMQFEKGQTGMVGVVETTVQHFTATQGTGVFAKVNQNIMTGKAMDASSVVTGTVFVNGFASGNIASSLNNPRETRANVVRAINLISDKTGVRAIDTGSDTQGVSLVAADGRNIEVRFETAANAGTFGDRVGLREGVQTGTFSLESKIEAPIILTSSIKGDINHAGMIAGNFTKNQSVYNSSPRPAVPTAQAQVERVTIGGTLVTGDVFKVTVRNIEFSATVDTVGGPKNAMEVRDALITQIHAQKDLLGVDAKAGGALGEMLLTATVPGTPFDASTTPMATGSAGTLVKDPIAPQANIPAPIKTLGMNDLTLNGIKIRPTSNADDIYSSALPTSSDPSASAIAIATAINAQSNETGVRAQANPVISQGVKTKTQPDPVAGNYALYVNGTKVSVYLDPMDTEAQRRTNVAAAINLRSGQHGITAVDNGKGITLTSDGRNMSVWFDANVKGLSAASFGLDKGGPVEPQVSKIAVSGVAADAVSFKLNGVTIQGGLNGTKAVDNLMAAFNAIATDPANPNWSKLQNLRLEASVDGNSITVSSTIAGTGFDLSGATVDPSTSANTISMMSLKANTQGTNDVTAIRGGDEKSTTASTLYGTVRLITDPALLPSLPAPGGAPPSDKAAMLKATGKPFSISVGDDGFGTDSNFSALGFEVGTFGGRSSESMDPPRVGRLAFQVGASNKQVITIDLADFGKNGSITGEITGDVDLNIDSQVNRINTRDGASAILTKLDSVMDKINATRATMGAVMNRLDHVINNLTNVSMNLSTSRSGIEDADYAASSTELAKTQIMQQAATAVLAQANTSQQTVLKLLGG